jgi:alpha-glucoside transport system permease protein
MNWDHLKHQLSKLPLHIVIIGIIIIWIIPALGLLVTSFRPVQDVNTTGWWTVLQPPTGSNRIRSFMCRMSWGKRARN